jgi:acetylornithine/succinyldiaminopimelate/putrescine aminotransferase
LPLSAALFVHPGFANAWELGPERRSAAACSSCPGPDGRLVKATPALTITDEEIDEALARLARV